MFSAAALSMDPMLRGPDLIPYRSTRYPPGYCEGAHLPGQRQQRSSLRISRTAMLALHVACTDCVATHAICQSGDGQKAMDTHRIVLLQKRFHIVSLRKNVRMDGPGSYCGVRQVLDRLGDKWSVLAISVVRGGPMRFSELRRALDGVSQKVLADLIRSLERDGFFSRHVVARTPLHVEYRLTTLGHALATLLDDIERWARVHEAELAARRRAYDEARGESS
jgi:DNA-binding HxlR family transcriptional regulator